MPGPTSPLSDSTKSLTDQLGSSFRGLIHKIQKPIMAILAAGALQSGGGDKKVMDKIVDMGTEIANRAIGEKLLEDLVEEVVTDQVVGDAITNVLLNQAAQSLQESLENPDQKNPLDQNAAAAAIDNFGTNPVPEAGQENELVPESEGTSTEAAEDSSTEPTEATNPVSEKPTPKVPTEPATENSEQKNPEGAVDNPLPTAPPPEGVPESSAQNSNQANPETTGLPESETAPTEPAQTVAGNSETPENPIAETPAQAAPPAAQAPENEPAANSTDPLKETATKDNEAKKNEEPQTEQANDTAEAKPKTTEPTSEGEAEPEPQETEVPTSEGEPLVKMGEDGLPAESENPNDPNAVNPQTSGANSDAQSQEGGPNAEAGSESTNGSAQNPQKRDRIQQRGGMTQAVNAFRNRDQLKEINTKRTDLQTANIELGKKIKEINKKIEPEEKEISRCKNRARALTVIRWGLFGISILFSITVILLLFVPEILGARWFLKKKIEKYDEQRNDLLGKIKTEIEDRKKLVTQKKKNAQQITTYDQQEMRLRNQFLLQMNSQV